jgi:hypothetical protein
VEVVDDHDEQATVWRGRCVRRHVRHGGGELTDERPVLDGHRDELTRVDRLRPAAIEDLEVVFREIGDRLIVVIRDDDIYADIVRARAKDRGLGRTGLRRSGVKRGDNGDSET